MTIYTFPEPFETALYGERGDVVAYRNGGFLFVRTAGSVTWTAADHLNPPPPIPAAARKPKVGEVWVINAGGSVRDLVRLVVNSHMTTAKEFKTLCPDGIQGTWGQDLFQRPATPQESEPFRPLLDGLKASLGEK